MLVSQQWRVDKPGLLEAKVRRISDELLGCQVLFTDKLIVNFSLSVIVHVPD